MGNKFNFNEYISARKKEVEWLYTDKELIDLINEAKNYLDKDECEKVILTLSQINQESEVNKDSSKNLL